MPEFLILKDLVIVLRRYFPHLPRIASQRPLHLDAVDEIAEGGIHHDTDAGEKHKKDKNIQEPYPALFFLLHLFSYFTGPIPESGQIRNTIFPTICSSDTHPTEVFRESMDASRLSPITKIRESGT